jgi:toxin ParE1/3/4
VALVRVSEQAQQDLLQITDDLCDFSLGAARRFVDVFETVVSQLRAFPESGPVRPDLGEGSRVLIKGRWVFVYRLRTDTVEVSRILDARRGVQYPGSRDDGGD